MNRYLAEMKTVVHAYDEMLSGIQVAMEQFVKEMDGRLKEVDGPLSESILMGQLRTDVALLEEAHGWVNDARLCLQAIREERELRGDVASDGGA